MAHSAATMVQTSLLMVPYLLHLLALSVTATYTLAARAVLFTPRSLYQHQQAYRSALTCAGVVTTTVRDLLPQACMAMLSCEYARQNCLALLLSTAVKLAASVSTFVGQVVVVLLTTTLAHQVLLVALAAQEV